MAGVVTVKLLDALKDIGVDVSQKQGSNVKTLATKNKSSATKPGLLASERDTGGNFGTVLDIFKKEAQFIEGMNDVEQMAFLNNIMDYNEFGGLKIKTTSELNQQAKDLGLEFKGLQTDLDKITSTAKTMKDDAEKGLASAKKDLDDFFETGGQPLKAKSDKYLGGSMHEEGQLRTAIRTFLKNEYKNGKIKLDETDQFRIMEYSPMMEDDPIKVFKKIYGDEAYKRAGTFPGAFEIGENFTHYEQIFKENMGEDLLKVKDKKYTGDGTLVLTKQEEVFEPTPDVDDDGIPFAKGGRASFVGGKLVDEFIAMIVKKEPIEAMKEVNKVIGKKGKYKNLTKKDIDRIVDQTEDHIFQRDPDNLFVEDRPMFKQETTSSLSKKDKLKKELSDIEDKIEDMIESGVDEMDPRLDKLNTRQNELGIQLDFEDKMDSATQIFKDSEGGIKGITMGGDDEFKKAMSEAMEEGMRESENMKRLGLDPTKMEDALKYDQMKEAGQMEKNITGLSDMSEADALRQKYPGITDDLVNKILIDDNPQRKAELIGTLDEAFRMMEKGKGEDEIIEIFKNTTRTKNSKGGRAGFMDGGASIINPESSMNNSSGLNYLLGEDDNSRVDFKNGLLVPPSKPKKPQDPMMKLMETYNTYQEALPGVSQETKKYLEQDFIKKLADQGFSINDFMTYRMQQNYANGGRAAFGGGGSMGKEDRGYQGGGRDKEGNVSGDAPGAAKGGPSRDGPDDRGSRRQNLVQYMVNQGATAKDIQRTFNPSAIDKIKSSRYNTPLTRGILRTGAYLYNPTFFGTELQKLMQAKKIVEEGKNLYDETKQQIINPDYSMEDLTLGLITDQQKNIIDKQGKIGQLTDAFDPDSTFNAAKKFDDEGGFFSDAEPMTREEYNQYVEQKGYAEGGLAGLLGERQGYAGGSLVDKGRRGFLKFLGGTAAGVVALKTGLAKILGKDSGAVSKKVIDEVIIDGGSGAPAWLQPLVNKALREGTDITKNNALKDGQVVKSLDTPTGKVDVYYDTRTGEVDVDYIGGNTALGESVNMRYTPGIADEGTKGVKPADEFEAVEVIPEGQMSSPNDYNVEFGENTTSNVKDLYSDTSELAELSGEKLLIKDISNSIQKKKVLKQMNENPDKFASDNLRDDFPDYDYGDINPNYD